MSRRNEKKLGRIGEEVLKWKQGKEQRRTDQRFPANAPSCLVGGLKTFILENKGDYSFLVRLG